MPHLRRIANGFVFRATVRIQTLAKHSIALAELNSTSVGRRPAGWQGTMWPSSDAFPVIRKEIGESLMAGGIMVAIIVQHTTPINGIYRVSSTSQATVTSIIF